MATRRLLLVLIASWLAPSFTRLSDQKADLSPEQELLEARKGGGARGLFLCGSAVESSASMLPFLTTRRLWPFAGGCPKLCEPTPPMLTLAFMRSELKPFAAAYAKRPRRVNFRGMSMSHAFSLWCVIRLLQPPVIVESGVYKAQGTYFIRMAAGPDAKILCLDPRPKSYEVYTDPNPNTLRFRGADFVDVAALDWDAHVPSRQQRARALVVLDDHMNTLKRMAQLARAGFKYVWNEDEGQKGSYRHSCTPDLAAHPRYIDNFGSLRLNISADEDRANLRALTALTAAYHVCPPLFNPCGHTLHADRVQAPPPDEDPTSSCAVPHWRGVLAPSEVVPYFREANGTDGLLMRELVHSYPPLIVLQPGLLASPSSSSSQAEAMRALLGDTTPYRLAAEARDKGASKSLRVAGVHGKLKMKCSGSAAGCVPIL